MYDIWRSCIERGGGYFFIRGAQGCAFFLSFNERFSAVKHSVERSKYIEPSFDSVRLSRPSLAASVFPSAVEVVVVVEGNRMREDLFPVINLRGLGRGTLGGQCLTRSTESFVASRGSPRKRTGGVPPRLSSPCRPSFTPTPSFLSPSLFSFYP